jgi:ribosomal protein S18 acetylase RimI-like enzyme
MRRMSLIVRRLRITDFPALEQIEEARVARAPRSAGWQDAFRMLLERSLSEEPEGLLIADRDGAVIGSAIARQRGAHPSTGVPYGHIEHLSVAATPDSASVSLRLLRECEAYLRSRGCELLVLSLPADDAAAAELFTTNGYRVTVWQLERLLK